MLYQVHQRYAVFLIRSYFNSIVRVDIHIDLQLIHTVNPNKLGKLKKCEVVSEENYRVSSLLYSCTLIPLNFEHLVR